MLGILINYWIGKWYYKLEEKHGRSKWGFAILGPVTYYVGQVLGVVIIMLGYFVSGNEEAFFETNERLLDFMGVPFGALACWGLYQLLKRKWEQKALIPKQVDVLDNLDDL